MNRLLLAVLMLFAWSIAAETGFECADQTNDVLPYWDPDNGPHGRCVEQCPDDEEPNEKDVCVDKKPPSPTKPPTDDNDGEPNEDNDYSLQTRLVGEGRFADMDKFCFKHKVESMWEADVTFIFTPNDIDTEFILTAVRRDEDDEVVEEYETDWRNGRLPCPLGMGEWNICVVKSEDSDPAILWEILFDERMAPGD